MARIRSIKPEFFTSAQVAECSPSARLLFVGLWCFCDDSGVHPAKIKQVKMEVFPGDSFQDSDIEALANELLDSGLLAEFENENQRYWFVTGWKHQKIDKPSPAKYPLPTDPNSTITRRSLHECSSTIRLGSEWNGEESNGIEGRGVERGTVLVEPPNPPEPVKSTKKKFTPPTVDEVREYCQECGSAVDPGQFCSYYESIGWKVGSNPMKCWKSAVQTWVRRSAESNSQGTGHRPAGQQHGKSGLETIHERKVLP